MADVRWPLARGKTPEMAEMANSSQPQIASQACCELQGGSPRGLSTADHLGVSLTRHTAGAASPATQRVTFGRDESALDAGRADVTVAVLRAQVRIRSSGDGQVGRGSRSHAQPKDSSALGESSCPRAQSAKDRILALPPEQRSYSGAWSAAMEAAGGEGMQVDGGASNPGDRMYEGVRSIFYYNTEVQPGQSVGLHLFEPRYRVLVKRAVEEPARNRELIFLP